MPDLASVVVTPFAKYGLLGCCVGAIVLAQFYQQHVNTKSLDWAYDQIQAEQEAARKDRETNWRAIRENTEAMKQVVAELHAARKGQEEIKKGVKAVEQAVKEGP